MAEHERRGQVIQQGVAGLAHVATEWLPDERTLSSSVRLTLDEAALGKTADQVSQALRDGSPSIWAGSRDNTLYLCVTEFFEGDEYVVAERLREVLSSQ
jgi:hypothetical protein